ncbi:hypothetical protein [Flagellimonas meridianipacifica]|uniref:Limonene hydroxylase n=1 Tax=Flagellimonas meridianipacifica TaxID=1080225 RepID=A0A2T0MGU7_9FLAO|nr:hypothetical protein [Allomuricauda pacifica]PRX56798.1 hypothetical protein CLV81_0796 [Allomuricauda pacifica]
MIDWIKNLLNSEEPKEILDWETDKSILEHLKSNISEDGSLNDSAETLPDEKRKENEVKFAPGLVDAMFGADESQESKLRIKQLVTLIGKIARKGDNQSKSDFYREITENESVIGIIDEFLQKIGQSSFPIEPHLFNYAHKLATKTNNRNSVKFGIAILGLCQNKMPIDDIKILGLHDEFTVFSTVALSNLSDNLVFDLWELAKQVDGWGKIQLVDRLAEMELTSEIRDWLLLEGYKNNIMYEYLALTCAKNGMLNEKLRTKSIDEKLYVSAGDIIIALLDEGPAVGMSGYDDRGEAIESFIRHSKTRNLNISNYVTLNRIKDYLEESPEENETLKNWNQNDLSNCLIDINELLNSKDWTAEVNSALKGSDNIEYWNGKQAAHRLGIDIWNSVWTKLKQNALDSSAWYDVTENAKENKVDEIIDFAISNLPLEFLGSGPQDSMGFGEDYDKHSSLDYILTFLGKYPRKGERLILVGLDSPVTRNRNMAIRALDKWKEENWSEEITEKIKQLKKVEPNTDTKNNIERLLKGEELV